MWGIFSKKKRKSFEFPFAKGEGTLREGWGVNRYRNIYLVKTRIRDDQNSIWDSNEPIRKDDDVDDEMDFEELTEEELTEDILTEDDTLSLTDFSILCETLLDADRDDAICPVAVFCRALCKMKYFPIFLTATDPFDTQIGVESFGNEQFKPKGGCLKG